VSIVNRDQQRTAFSHIAGQPVQAVENRRRSIGRHVTARGDFERLEDRLRVRGPAAEKLSARIRRRRDGQVLEQLSHHPERELALEVVATRCHHLKATALGFCATGPQQAGLADPRRSLDERDATTTPNRFSKHAPEPRKLSLTFDQNVTN
jgi:hypothetical protein